MSKPLKIRPRWFRVELKTDPEQHVLMLRHLDVAAATDGAEELGVDVDDVTVRLAPNENCPVDST